MNSTVSLRPKDILWVPGLRQAVPGPRVPTTTRQGPASWAVHCRDTHGHSELCPTVPLASWLLFSLPLVFWPSDIHVGHRHFYSISVPIMNLRLSAPKSPPLGWSV